MADLHSCHPPSADPPTEWYTYVPLCNEQQDPSGLTDSELDPTIRLMTLLPGTGSDPIQCSLAVVKPISGIRIFDKQLKPPDIIYYEALSYVWGDVSKTEQIICDGKLLKITESLAVALRALRQPERSRVLWADGICINQQDTEERSSQVLLMSSIFSLATQVICWLGHDDDGHAKFVFQLAEKVATEFNLDSFDTNGLAIIDAATVFEQHNEYLSKIITTVSDGEESLISIIAASLTRIASLLHRPWFSRMWIRQEVGYASKAVVMSGKSELDAKILHWLIVWAVIFDEFGAMFELPMGSVHAFTSYGHSPLISLLDLLVGCRPWTSTDPRDKIFALLSHPTAWIEEPFAGEKDYCARVMATMRAGRGQEVLPELVRARLELQQDLHNWLLVDPRRPLTQDVSKILRRQGLFFPTPQTMNVIPWPQKCVVRGALSTWT